VYIQHTINATENVHSKQNRISEKLVSVCLSVCLSQATTTTNIPCHWWENDIQRQSHATLVLSGMYVHSFWRMRWAAINIHQTHITSSSLCLFFH